MPQMSPSGERHPGNRKESKQQGHSIIRLDGIGRQQDAY